MLPVIISVIETPEDRDMMTEYYLNNNKLLYKEAGRYLDDPMDIEDAVLEAIKNIIEKIEVFRDLRPGQQRRYGLVTVRNVSFMHKRKAKHFGSLSMDARRGLETQNTAAYEPDMQDVAIERMLMEQIWEDMDPQDRTVLEQKYILQWQDETIAEALGIRPDSMRTRLSRARKKLLARLEKADIKL